MHRTVRNADERAELLAAYEASGLSVAAFADREKVPRSTFYQWLANDTRRRSMATRLRMARLVCVAAPKPSPAEDASLVVVLGAARVEVRHGFERDTLGDVLDVLAARAARERA